MKQNNFVSKSAWILLFFFVFLNLTFGQQKEVKVYDDFDTFEKEWLNWPSDTTLVLNFWATWCKPCVKELPYFEALNQIKSENPVKVVLVSIDKKSEIETRLKPFLAKREMTTHVVLLAAGGAHIWIDKVDPSWSGAVPATLIIKKNKKEFYEKEFESLEDLLATVNNVKH